MYHTVYDSAKYFVILCFINSGENIAYFSYVNTQLLCIFMHFSDAGVFYMIEMFFYMYWKLKLQLPG